MSGAFTARGGHIVMSDQTLVSNVWRVFLHEVGHLADFWKLDDTGRARVVAEIGRDRWDYGSKESWAHSFARHYPPPNLTYTHPHNPVSGSLIDELMEDDMASSEDIRKWYHEDVVLNHADRGNPGYEPVCNHNYPTVAFPRSGGVFNEPVHPLCFEAFEAYTTVMRHLGVDMPGAGGVNSCRNIGTSDNPSLHSYLCAVDLPPNSFKPAEFLAAIKTIRTNSGAQVFRTLRGDRMHDQINCSPTGLATGIDWSTVAGHQGDDDMAILSDEAQQFWEDNYRKALEVLDPMTNEDMTHTLVNHVRDHPTDDGFVKKGETVVIKGTS